MIQSSIFKHNTSIKMIILLITMKRETLKKMRFHSKTTKVTHLLIIIIRSPSSSSSNNKLHKHLTSTRSQQFSINTIQMWVLTTTCLLKAGWWMEEAQILTLVLTKKSIVSYLRPQQMYSRQTEKEARERESASTRILSTKQKAHWTELLTTLTTMTQLRMALISNLIIASWSRAKLSNPHKPSLPTTSTRGVPRPATCFSSSASRRSRPCT